MKGHSFNILTPLGLVVAIVLSGFLLTIPNTNADDSSVSTATISVPVSCSMIGATETAHSAEIPNGIDSRSNEYYPNGIGSTSIKAFCNDSEGFAIYAVGYTGDVIGNNHLRDNALSQTDDIQTSTTFSGANSAWAMKIGATTGTYTPIIAGSTSDSEKQSGDTDYSTWAEVPSSYQRVAYRNSATDLDNGNLAAEGAQLTTTYAAYISPTQKAGTYVGKVKYTLVHPANEVPLQPQPAAAGKIVYHPDGGNTIGTMADQSANNNASVTLYPSNFSRQGFGFAGWSTTYDYSDPTGFYGPNETITTPPDTTTNGLSLYAIWIKSSGNMQEWSGCDSLTEGSVTALTDLRDNDVYAVAKLSDGYCWMIENLRLDSTAAHNSDGSLAQGYGTSTTYGNFSGLADPEQAWPEDSTVANSLYYSGAQTGTASIDISTYIYPQFRFPRYNNENTTSRNSHTTTNENIYSLGNYYTWAAAIADTVPYENIDHTAMSICPKNWQLPLGKTSTGDIDQGALDTTNRAPGFSYLDRKLGGTGTNQISAAASLRWRKYPNNFVYSGVISSGETIGARGGWGIYASATSDNDSSSTILLAADSIIPDTRSVKYYGYSIRCIYSNN